LFTLDSPLCQTKGGFLARGQGRDDVLSTSKKRYYFSDDVFITRNKEVCRLLPEETIPDSEKWETNRGCEVDYLKNP
jgi:hypothetical protein